IAVRPATASIPGARSSDAPPDFTPLVPDARMQGILVRRWRECSTCVNSGAALAAIVMMGGLLEGLLLARIHRETDRHRLVTASTAPKDRSTGKAVPLTVWTLKDYINVAHELSWISQSVRDISVVLRDYRNYIHPQKEYSHGIPIEPGDAYVLWEVAKSIARQLIAGTKRTARA